MIRGLFSGLLAGAGAWWLGVGGMAVTLALALPLDPNFLAGSHPYFGVSPVAVRLMQFWAFVCLAFTGGAARWIASWPSFPGRPQVKQVSAVLIAWLGFAGMAVPGTWPLAEPVPNAHFLRDALVALPFVLLGARFLPPRLSARFPLRETARASA